MSEKNEMVEFWAIPKSILKLKGISLEAKMVYAVLFTRTNGDNVAWPGQKCIAEILQISERSVRRYVEELKKMDLVEVERMGLRKTNRYCLTQPKFLTGQLDRSRADSPVLSRADNLTAPIVRDLTVREQMKESDPTSADVGEGKIVNDLIEQFEAINPSFAKLYKNTSQRKAIQRLLKIMSEAELKKVINFLPTSNKNKFAPTITTPIQLEDKMGALKAFCERQKEAKLQNSTAVVGQ